MSQVESETTMRLFVWHGILESYSSGLAFALATDAQHARELIVGSVYADPSEEVAKYRQWQSAVANDEDAKFNATTLWRDLMIEPEVYDTPYGDYIYGGD